MTYGSTARSLGALGSAISTGPTASTVTVAAGRDVDRVRLAGEDVGAAADRRRTSASPTVKVAVPPSTTARISRSPDSPDQDSARVEPQQGEVEQPARVERQRVAAVLGGDVAVVAVVHGSCSLVAQCVAAVRPVPGSTSRVGGRVRASR